jgi:glucose/mannose transport system substrate-binding protein
MQPLGDVYQENGLNEVFPKGLLEIVSYDGHPWSVPLQVYRTNVLWYNTALFEKAGIRKAPETWDEFLADAELLKEQGIVPLALAGDWTVGVLFESLLAGNLGPDRYQGLWSGTTAWDDPGVTAALEQFQRILPYVAPTTPP